MQPHKWFSIPEPETCNRTISLSMEGFIGAITTALGINSIELYNQFVSGAQLLLLPDGSIVEDHKSTLEHGVYFVVKGCILVETEVKNNEYVPLYTAIPGCSIGVSSAITGDIGTMRARVVTGSGKAEVIKLNLDVFRKLLYHPKLLVR